MSDFVFLAELDPGMIVPIGIAAVITFFVGKFLIKGDSRVEARREDAIELAELMADQGFPTSIGKALRAYAVGDYSGLIAEIKSIRSALGKPGQLKGAMDHLLETQFNKYMADDGLREDLLSKIEKKLAIKIPRTEVGGQVTELVKKSATVQSSEVIIE